MDFEFSLTLPSCGSCKAALQSENDSLACEKCKKNHHWSCTGLDDYTIKLYKKNPYKPWRCVTCTEKYCYDCNKLFPEDCQESICCGKCSFWYHRHCTDLTLDKFKFHSENPSARWICKKCTKNFCKKCDSSVHHKPKISCCICRCTYHFSCAKIQQLYKNDNNFLKNWICITCKPDIFPFAKLDNKKLFELSNHSLDKYSRDNLSTSTLSNQCSVCDQYLTRNNKGIPCSCCQSSIHVKCTNVDPKNFHLYRGNWQCQKCMKNNFPFLDLQNKPLQELQFNSSLVERVKKFKPEVTIDEKLKLMLSYSKQSPWYAYTHPDEQEHDFFTTDTVDNMTLKPNFDYYDIDQFRKVKNLWNKKKSLGIFHTNICSLQKNVDSLEDLLHDLDYSFDVIALTETWNPEKNKDTFRAKQLPGYLDYYGVEGSSLKGGCGFYIKDSFTPIPRKDLEFKLGDTGSEAENCWIELVNNAGPNVLVGVFYRHPSRNSGLFLEKLKATMKIINREKKENCYLW